MQRDGSGKLDLKTSQGHGPYEGAIAAWKEASLMVDCFVDFCHTLPLEEFGDTFTPSSVHPYRYWPGIEAVVKNDDIAKFIRILKQIVNHREDLRSREAFGSNLSPAQKRMVKYFDSILTSPMKAASSCWMNLIRCIQRNKAGVHDQPYTKKGDEHYSVEQQQQLMSPVLLATTVKVLLSISQLYNACLLIFYALQLILLLVHGELNGLETHQQKLAKIYCEKIAPYSLIMAQLQMFHRRLFSPRVAQANVFFLQANVDFIELQPQGLGAGKPDVDDNSSTVSGKASGPKACFGFVYTREGQDSPNSSGGGGDTPRMPSPHLVSSRKPPLPPPSPREPTGLFSP